MAPCMLQPPKGILDGGQGQDVGIPEFGGDGQGQLLGNQGGIVLHQGADGQIKFGLTRAKGGLDQLGQDELGHGATGEGESPHGGVGITDEPLSHRDGGRDPQHARGDAAQKAKSEKVGQVGIHPSREHESQATEDGRHGIDGLGAPLVQHHAAEVGHHSVEHHHERVTQGDLLRGPSQGDGHGPLEDGEGGPEPKEAEHRQP